MALTINAVMGMSETERTALTDEQIISLGYGIDRYDPYVAGYAAPECKRQMQIIGAELKPRLVTIKAAQTAQPKARRQHDYLGGRVLDCGCVVYDAVEVMTSSRGTSCADCYDWMSR